MRALVTGFEPFGGSNENASRAAVLRLPARVGTLDLSTAVLPTSYARSLAVLTDAIAATRPQIVLCTGEAGERRALCVERVAVNLQHARIADNDGAQPQGSPVIGNGPVAYFSTLPVRTAVAALNAAGLPAEVSYSAGTFVCNHVFYGLMHLATTRAVLTRCGFLHLPRLRESASSRGHASSLTLDDVVHGIAIVLETAAAIMRPQRRSGL